MAKTLMEVYQKIFDDEAEPEVICHFSCGSTSAIATAIACKKFKCEIIYADTGSEHEDNWRFLKDCEDKLFHQKVTIVKSKKFNSIFEVFEDRNFLASPQGAPCTTHLKKIPIRDYLGDKLYSAKQCMGFDYSPKELKRIKKYRLDNPELSLYLPLIEMKLNKSNCLAMLQKFGVELPAMYKLGYSNANCIGCVKAENHRYWAAIRKDFPKIFDWYAKFERKIGKRYSDGTMKGAAINKKYVDGDRVRLFLDELPTDLKPLRKIDIYCGYSCGSAVEVIEDGEPEPLESISNADLEETFSWLK